MALSDKSADYLHSAMAAMAIKGQYEHIAVPTELVSAYLLQASHTGDLEAVQERRDYCNLTIL